MPTPTLSVSTYKVTLPPLHEGRNGSGGQLAIEQAGVRFECILCGRRWGKTTYGVRKCVKCVLTVGGMYWWVAPTYGVALPGWLMLKRLCQQMIDAGVRGIEIRESDRQVLFPKGEIWVKSADNPDSLRGHALHGVVLDEPAQIRSDAWYEVLQPALADYKGWATFIGTPKGKNWLYAIWRAAGTLEDWGRWRRFTLDNPYIDPAEVERARLTMSEESFKQEYEADFGASQYLVYPEFLPEVHMWKWDVPEFFRFHGGLDFGGNTIGAHKSAGVWSGITPADEMIICNVFEEAGPNIGERQLEWMAEQSHLVKKLRRFQKLESRNLRWRADKTQMWGIQLVRNAGYDIFPSKGGKDSVEEGIELVHRRLQVRTGPRGGTPRPRLFYLPDCAELVEQHFESYRYEEPEEGKLQKRHPLKVSDDLDDAVRYMVEDSDFGIVGDPNEIYKGTFGYMEQLPQVETFKNRLKRLKAERERRKHDGEV